MTSTFRNSQFCPKFLSNLLEVTFSLLLAPLGSEQTISVDVNGIGGGACCGPLPTSLMIMASWCSWMSRWERKAFLTQTSYFINWLLHRLVILFRMRHRLVI